MSLTTTEIPPSNEGDPEIWYCAHEYWHGDGCPDCDAPSYLPSAFDRDEERP